MSREHSQQVAFPTDGVMAPLPYPLAQSHLAPALHLLLQRFVPREATLGAYLCHGLQCCRQMTPEEIHGLLVPFLNGDALSADQLRILSAYLELLLKWNAKINLTAVRDPQEMVRRHFGESLFAARQLFPTLKSSSSTQQSLIDVGSGAGLPGLPIKIWNGGLKVVLLEAQQKKATFLREVVRSLQLPTTQVAEIRAEDTDIKADFVTLRAVERFEHVLPVAAALVQPEGTLALLIGTSQCESARSLVSHLSWAEPLPIPLSSARVLLVGRNEG
jgi:16S rRNA (guanine527-N7)-methyltransferase